MAAMEVEVVMREPTYVQDIELSQEQAWDLYLWCLDQADAARAEARRERAGKSGSYLSRSIAFDQDAGIWEAHARQILIAHELEPPIRLEARAVGQAVDSSKSEPGPCADSA
jgi:hypothetical protein